MKPPTKHRQPWGPDEVSELKKLIKGNTPTPLIAHKLKRTEAAVRAKSSDEGLSLKPTNRSPYGTTKKA
jgi:hypothetical protein